MFLLTATAPTSAETAAQITQLLFVSVATAIYWIATSLVLASLFWKADEERWKAWIPFWRDFVFFKLGRLPGLLAALLPVGALLYSTALLINMPILPQFMVGVAAVCGLAFTILQYATVFRIAQSFQRRNVEWILLIVFLPFVFLIITAFDGSIWRDDDELGLNDNKPLKIATKIE